MDPETTFRSLSMEAAAPAEIAHGAPSIPTTRGARPTVVAPEVQDPWLLGFVQSALALATLVVLSPVMLIVAILVRATSPGPIFYRGARLGQGMRPFSIFKFRTLRVGSEGEIGARLLQPRDSFYTPIGRFLKRTKLDEIPQLWNVVRGDMNLVGPRPVRPVFLDEFLATIPGYVRRFAMKPGLTGVAQLRGGYFTTPAAKLRYELWYLRERSVSLDLAILTLTGVKLLNRWITLGGLLFALFIFVSFMPSGVLDSFYIYAFGVRMSVAHVAVAAVGAWLLVRRRHSD
ncbi:MAG: sugar transferase, partial [Candidatus Rokuibacteriota bacterium]